jgi:hypothetical protein
MTVTVEELRKLFEYDAATGVVTWRVDLGRAVKGARAGGAGPGGYRYVWLHRRRRLEHRIAWALHFGEVPPSDIDHVNCDKADNRIENLRLASITENNRNRPKLARNRTGFKGVYARGSSFVARIGVDKRRIELGAFRTAEEAHAAYVAAAKELHGEFARA